MAREEKRRATGGGVILFLSNRETDVGGLLTSVICERTRLIDELFTGYSGPPFAIRMWDGWYWRSSEARPVCTVVVRSPEALETLLLRPSEIALGEAFLANEIDVEGDIFAVFGMEQRLVASGQGLKRRVVEALLQLFQSFRSYCRTGRKHSPARDGAAISQHYDQPAAFYRPWLGKSMVYSCAYFRSAEDDLDTAQFNKLDLICRKLRLRREDRFLDIGCGWGSLVLHAAEHYGVYASGVTISSEQAEVAQTRIEQAALTQSSRVELTDYRRTKERLGEFEKIASVGMFEHVGPDHLPEYFRTVHELLRPGGVFLNHGIARAQKARFRGPRLVDALDSPLLRRIPLLRKLRDPSFIDKYVFPDGELATITQAVQAAEQAGFEVRDVENLREHYERTLRLWVEGLRVNAATLLNLVSETTYRTWLLYMAGCAAAFRRGEIAVYQMLLSRPDGGRSALPMTREDWYRPVVRY